VRSSKSEEMLSYSNTSNTNTLRSMNDRMSDFNPDSKYHTLRSLDLKYNTLKNSESIFGSCWSSRNVSHLKNKLKRPVLLGRLNAAEADEYFEMTGM
jgi:hypothetical protein